MQQRLLAAGDQLGKAAALSPENALFHASRAAVLLDRSMDPDGQRVRPLVAEARACADRALLLDPGSPKALAVQVAFRPWECPSPQIALEHLILVV